MQSKIRAPGKPLMIEAHRRLEPQVRLASENGLLPATARDRLLLLYQQLPAIFAPEPPADNRQSLSAAHPPQFIRQIALTKYFTHNSGLLFVPEMRCPKI